MRSKWTMVLLFTPFFLMSGAVAGNAPDSQDIKITIQPLVKPEPAKKGKLYFLATGQERNWKFLPDGFDLAMRSQGKEMYREIHGRILHHKECTKQKILEGLDWMCENATADDLVMFFIGNHGMCVGGPNGESVISTNGGGNLKPQEVKSRFAKLPCEAIVINDGCQSGNWPKEREGDPMPPNVTALCCCLPTQNSCIQFDITVFEALHGKADYNKDGIVDLDELITYAGSRIKELGNGPLCFGGTLTPVLHKSKNLKDKKLALPLTKANPNLVSVVCKREVFTGLVESQDGDNYKIRVIGFGGKGDPYGGNEIPTSYARANVILPTDGAPLMVKKDNGWFPAYFVRQQNEEYTVRVIGSDGDAVVSGDQVFRLFGATPNEPIPAGLFKKN